MTSIAQARRQASDLADLIEQIGADVAARYGRAEAEAIAMVARHVQAVLNGTTTPAQRQKALGELRVAGERLAADVTDPTYIRHLMGVAAQEGVAVTVGTGSIAEAAVAAALARVVADTSQRLAVLRAPMADWMVRIYRRAITIGVGNLVAGVDTVQEAQRRSMQNLIANGIQGYRDAGGRMWRVGSYAEMAVRTGAMEAWDAGHIAAMREAGLSLVQIVAGVGACKVCSAHTGKVYSTDGTPAGVYLLKSPVDGSMVAVTVAGTLDEARAQGWRHPNCRCTTVAYLPGGVLLKGSTYDPDAERARDQLRTLERTKRDVKRREAAALDDLERQRARARLRELDARIREHTARTGLNRRRYREQLSFSDGRTSQ